MVLVLIVYELYMFNYIIKEGKKGYYKGLQCNKSYMVIFFLNLYFCLYFVDVLGFYVGIFFFYLVSLYS